MVKDEAGDRGKTLNTHTHIHAVYRFFTTVSGWIVKGSGQNDSQMYLGAGN